MKRVIIYLGCLALLLTGCNKIEMVEEPVVDSSDKLAIDIEVSFDGDTRAVKGGWENQDAIYVVFDHYFSPNKDADTDNPFVMVLRYYDGAWEVESLPTALEMYLQKKVNKTGYLAAVYFSDYNDRRLPTTFSYRKLTEGDYLVPVGSISYTVSPTVLQQRAGFLMSDKSVQYTIEDGKLKASLNMKIDPNLVHFYIPGTENLDASGRKRFSFRCEQFGWQNLLRFESTYIAELGEIHEWYSNPFVRATVDYSTSIPAAVYPNGVRFCGYLRNEVKGIETEYVIVVTDNKGTPDDDSDDTIYTLKKTATLNGKEAIKLPPLTDSRWVKSWVSNSGTYNGHPWVRMGDGVRWATSNVAEPGGMVPDDGRCYYTWYVANNNSLWGEGWRVPTPEEWNSLGANINHTFEHRFIDGVYWGTTVRASNTGQEIYLRGNGALDADGNRLTGSYYDPVTFEKITENNPYGFFWTSTNDGSRGKYAFVTEEQTPVEMMWQNPNYYMSLRLVLDE